MRRELREVVAGLPPGDGLAERHRAEALAWLDGTDDVYRRIAPAVPDPHPVVYVVPRDPATGRVLLLDHVTSGLWLPPGGHVEAGEQPHEAAVRETAEELGITCAAADLTPSFVTVTQTVGAGRHTDVTIWFPLRLPIGTGMHVDRREARGARWWSPAQVREETRIEPHLDRFLRAAA